MPTDAEIIVAQCLNMRARRLSRQLTRMYEHEMEGLELTAARFNVLVVIAANPGIYATELVEPLEIDKSTLSRNLQRLEKQGLVKSKPVPGTRSRALHPTEAGETLIAKARPSWERAQARARASIGELAPVLLSES